MSQEELKVETTETIINNAQPVDAVVSPDAPKEEKPKEEKAYQRPSYAYTPPPRGSRWSSGYGGGANPLYLQPDHMTREERFPLIFDSAKKLKPDAKRILSFGCSTGEECQSLAKRFPGVEIVGLEIDHVSIQTARKKNTNENIFFHDEIGGLGNFDLCTALMVFFCMEEAIPKDRIVTNLKNIDKHLNPGAVLMVYTADHDPTEILGPNYEPLNVWLREHNKNKKQYYSGYYRKRGGTSVEKLDIDPAKMPSND